MIFFTFVIFSNFIAITIFYKYDINNRIFIYDINEIFDFDLNNINIFNFFTLIYYYYRFYIYYLFNNFFANFRRNFKFVN